ncbi:MAG TPA: glutamate--cysteine ligase [Burkholderiales bacterium]|nr:glutamate--cysteine ligase [Burkholderiales bacterium]
MQTLEKRLSSLAPQVLAGLRRGVEKEGLRTRPDGMLALTAHSAGLGSPLTHPNVTTDFSESQLELITNAHPAIKACLDELTEIHQFVYRNIGDELLWCASMPCRLPADDEIPLARYGTSNVAQAKTIYRRGLSYRYGRTMQTISGLHYNFSLPDAAWPALQAADGDRGPERQYRDGAYFALIRNFRRHSWLLLYLFGASPAACTSFVEGRKHPLQPLTSGTMYLPHATSLRMGPLGYQSDAQASLAVSYNCLESYARSLYSALTEPYPQYTAIGITDGTEYRQLSATLLQIENEFYGTIRPKRPVRPGERPLHALSERGVEYVEVRCMDLDPYSPIGIKADTMRFLDVFLLHCLLHDSPPDTPAEIAANSRNQHRVALRGRESGLRLERGGLEVTLKEWSEAVLAECAPIARALDSAHDTNAYGSALAAAGNAITQSSTTPSARVLRDMASAHEDSYLEFTRSQSARHREYLKALPWDAALNAKYERLAAASREEQRAIEAADSMSFEAYRRQYLALDLLS